MTILSPAVKCRWKILFNGFVPCEPLLYCLSSSHSCVQMLTFILTHLCLPCMMLWIPFSTRASLIFAAIRLLCWFYPRYPYSQLSPRLTGYLAIIFQNNKLIHYLPTTNHSIGFTLYYDQIIHHTIAYLVVWCGTYKTKLLLSIKWHKI